MTLAAFSPLGVIMLPRGVNSSASDGSVLLDATTDYCAWVFQVPVTGPLDKVHIRTGTGTPVGATMSAQFYTLDSAGDPSATVYGGSTQVDVASPSASSTVTFSGFACSATAGDYVAVKVWFSALTSGSLNLVTGPATPGWTANTSFPYSTTRASGTGAGTHGVPTGVGIEYSGGLFYDCAGLYPSCTSISENLDADGSIRRAGNYLSASPCAMTIVGAYATLDNDTNNTTIKLYDTDGSTVLATATLDSGRRGSTAHSVFMQRWDGLTRVRITKGAGPYRVVAQTDNSATAAVGVRGIQNLPSAASMDQLDLGQLFYATSYNGTAWSETTTKRYSVGLLVELDDGFGVGRAMTQLGL